MEKDMEIQNEAVTEAPEVNAAPPAKEAPGAPEPSAVPPAEAGEVGEEKTTAAHENTEDVPVEDLPPVAPDWQFGDPPATEKTAKKQSGSAFGIAFGSVIGVCILLLAITLLLGEGNFQILRTIFTERTVFVREYDSSSGLLTPEEAGHVVKQSTVTVIVRTEEGGGIGSGFVYSADGYICTNYHVIESQKILQVMLPDGEVRDASVVGYNVAADLAVLKIEAGGLTPAVLGSSADLLLGQDVLAVGTPGKVDYRGTVTYGKVSDKARLVQLADENGTVQRKMTLIQTDTSVNPGNSGGPLADMYGHVVGVVVMKVKTINGTTFDGLGFAIPIDGAKTIIDAIIKDGKFTGKNPVAEGRSQLGVTGRGLVGGVWYDDPAADQPISSATEKPGYFKMPCDGIYVMSTSGSNAAGSLREGDIIIKIDGQNMYTIHDVISAVNRHYEGETVTVTALRPGFLGDYEEISVKITLTEGAD